MANVTVFNSATAKSERANRCVVRTSGDRVYVGYSDSVPRIIISKGNAKGEPTSFTLEDSENSAGTNVGLAIAIDSNDIIHCCYYHVDTSHSGILAFRYVQFDTSTDTFGTPEDIASLDNDGGRRQFGICVDANDDPHVFWVDALTDMGNTTHTTWYANKISGWSTRLVVAENENEREVGFDIMVADPLSSVNADRPIVAINDPILAI